MGRIRLGLRKCNIADCQTALCTTKSTKSHIWGKERCCHHLQGKDNLLHFWIAPIWDCFILPGFMWENTAGWVEASTQAWHFQLSGKESIAFNSGSDFATTPEGGSLAESSSSEDYGPFFIWKSTNIVSACLWHRHERQWSWSSEKVRKQSHPETNRWSNVFRITHSASSSLRVTALLCQSAQGYHST